MRRPPRGGRRSVNRGTHGRSIEPRNQVESGCRRRCPERKATYLHTPRRVCGCAAAGCSGWSACRAEEPAVVGFTAAREGDPGQRLRQPSRLTGTGRRHGRHPLAFRPSPGMPEDSGSGLPRRIGRPIDPHREYVPCGNCRRRRATWANTGARHPCEVDLQS
jgi:hypothetical protein